MQKKKISVFLNKFMRIKSNNSIAAFIFARGGSKGIPKKNTKELCGHPLIAYSINIALENKNIDKVYVSTDDQEIATISKKYGAEVPFIRPSELAQDNSKEWDAWQHAMNFLKEHNSIPDIMISLPPTSPLRSQEDINACIQKIIETDLDAVISVTKSQRHPMFNMVVESDSKTVELFSTSENNYSRRQDLPLSYDITTVAYAVRSDFIMNSK